MAVYAPNAPNEISTFWSKMTKKVEEGAITDLDALVGDFNITLNPLDRLPHREDNRSTTEAFMPFLTMMNLKDRWRELHPDKMAYTYMQSGAQGRRHSRLDRIHLRSNMLPHSKEWNIQNVRLPTDHHLVTARVSNKFAPHIGQGRWTFPSFLLKDKELLDQVKAAGIKLKKDIDKTHQRINERNPQTLYKEFKTKVAEMTRERARTKIPKVKKHMDRLDQEMRDLLRGQNSDKLETRIRIAEINKELNYLERMRHLRTRENLTTKIRMESESPTSRQWARSGRENRPRDPFYELKIPHSTPPKYERRSDRMAELAKDYHDILQEQGLRGLQARQEVTTEVLTHIPSPIPESFKEELTKNVETEDVRQIIRTLPNGKAAGLDGLTYELWKKLNEDYMNNSKMDENDKPNFDITETLTRVFKDIEEHGIEPRTGFADGWMCPVYKNKGEKTEIASYRPLTMLNANYKIFSKSLTNKLAHIAPNIIHENQAGFVPGRSIAEQVRLTEMILHYTKEQDEDGAKVALDQEKAYDKIAHEYLWKTLEKYEFPTEFIRTVRTLYENAETAIMINGVLSEKYKIQRGV